jgi:oligopeptidase B
MSTEPVTTEAALTPPCARAERTEHRIHGHVLADDYAWLRQKDSPETLAYLNAENAYTKAVMAPTAGLQKQLYDEMVSHIKETDVSVPFLDGAFWYYSRTEQGRQYPIYCRKPAHGPVLDDTAPEEILLDINALAEKESYFAIGAMTVSDDGHLLAFSTDTTGFRQYTLHVKDLRTGEILAESAESVGSVVWAADNRTLFYTVEDPEQKRQFQFFRHVLGTPHSEDALIFEEKDERFNIGAGRTRDGEFLILQISSHTTSEEQFLRADSPQGLWTLIEPRRNNIEYYVNHRHGHWYIRVNDTGRNFRLVSAPQATPSRQYWTELMAHRDDVMLEEVDLFAGFCVAFERRQGLEHLRVIPFPGEGPTLGESTEISFPEPAYTTHPHINRVFDTTRYRYAYQSLVTPSSVYEYDVATGQTTLLKQLEVPGGFDRTLYTSERIFAKAADGVEVPLSLVYRKDSFTRGKNPLWIYGYGSYGYPLPMGFNSNRLSLLDRGLVLAYAHIRGGGDMGKPWHDAGRLMHKRNTFTDFIAVTEHLAANGYGDPARIAAEGGSAGGLLMGAIVNLRPDLYRAIVSHVPFVDVMNTMLDASLPLTVPEYEEWGNPNEPEAFEYMLSYSPYDNLKPGSYPAILVKTSLNDSQVMYWEPAKYVAKLRTLKQDDRLLLLHTNMSAGHGGASGRYDYLKEIAFDYAFLLRELGVVAL